MQKHSILFISNTSNPDRPFLDPSTRYRSYNLAEELVRMGFRTAVMAQSTFEEQMDELDDYDFTPSIAPF
jgi:hypothetical protein